MNASLVMINYNGGARAAENARILASQAADESMEFMVIDNSSSDGSDGLIRAAVPVARLVRELENRGYAAAVNRGLEEASGEVVIVLNADVVPRPGALRNLAAAALGGEFAILGGVLVDPSGRRSSNTARLLPRPIDILREGFFLRPRSPRLDITSGRGDSRGRAGTVPVPVVSGAVMAVRADALAKLGPMDDDFFLYNEDVEWCRRAHRTGLGVGLVTDALFDHEGGASTRTCEGPPFAARVLADFHYYCEGEGVSPEKIRRLERVRLIARSWLYRMDALLGVLGRRPESRRRAAIYRLLARALVDFRWSTEDGVQNGHPSRLFQFPDALREDREDPRPRILQLIPNMEYGGAQRLVETLVAGSLSRRYRFEVLCQTHVGEIGEELLRRGVPVHVVGMSGWRRLSDWKRLADYAALLEPDLVHSHLIPADIAAHIGFGGRVPRLSTKHNVDPKFTRATELLERHILKGVPVLAVSDAVALAKSHLCSWGMRPPVLQSPPSVPVASSPAPFFRKGEPVRLLAIGRLHPQKRLDIYVRAAAELERRFPGRFSFRVVGEGRELDALRALADELGVGDSVDFRPAVADVAAAMDDADIVVMTSDYEGSPLVILEMLARGRIPLIRRVLATDGALPGVLERCYVDSASPADVAKKVLEICAEPDHFVKLSREGLEWVKGRSDYASVTGEIYDELLRADAPRARKRVLHLITRLIVGGAQENTIASVERVDPERYDSQLWIGPQTGSEGSLLADARSRGIVVRVLPNLVREINPRRDALVLVQLVRLLRRGRFDIVHTHSSKAGILGRIAAKIAGVPHIVHTVHGWGFHDRMSPLTKNTYATLEKLLQPWTRPLISVSSKTTRVGLDEGIGRPDAYRLIRSGIPLTRFFPDPECGSEVRERLGLRADDIVIGSVGRLSPQKNPRDFVRVAELLLRAHENLMVVYVGDGPMRAEIERTLDSIGLSDRVLLLGIRDDVPDLLRAMDVFILTSLWEGLPRVVLQALATGLPVVAYDTAGIGEVVKRGKNGHLVEPGAVGEMVELLDRLVADASLRSAMGKAAVEEFGTAFTEDGRIRDLENLYDELTKSEGGGLRAAGQGPRGTLRGFEGGDQ